MADPVYRLMGVPEGTFRGRQPMVGRLVGRRRELEQLRAAWTQACGGQRRWWIVRGEPGIGKSRLLQEFSCGLRAQGARCLELAGHEQAMQSPFAAMLDGLQRQLGTERVCTPHADQRRWGDALLSTLTALAGEEPLCVLADDVQWLDASTLDLLRRLWGSREGARLLFVWGERTTDTGAGRAPPEAQALDLRGLDDREAAELVDQLDHPLPAAARRRVIERAGGVPLYLEECLRASSRELSIAEEDVPATLEDLLMVRLENLGRDLALAQLLSVLGRECQEPQLQALLALDDPFVEQALRVGSLDALLDSGLLQVLDGTPRRYRFKHALVAQAAYRTINHDVLPRLHDLCARLVEQATDGPWPQRPEALARHLEAAGRLDAACGAWAKAAQAAAARQAHPETAALAERALAVLGRLPPSEAHAQLEMLLHLLVASARIALYGYGSPTVEASYLAAEAAGRRLRDTTHSLRVRLGLEACFVMRGDLEQAERLAREAVSATDWSSQARLALQARWALANVQFHQGDWRRALKGFDDCLAHYSTAVHRPSSVQDPAIMCLGYASWVHFEIGQAEVALQCAERALHLADTLNHPFSTSVALGFAASLHRLCGDLDRAWPLAERALQIGTEGGFQVWLAHAWMIRGQLRADSGDFNGGDEDMARGYAMWVGSGARISCGTYLVTRAELLLRQGRTALARQHLDDAASVTAAIGERYYWPELMRLQGACAWQAGSLTHADERLRQAFELATTQGKLGLALRCALTLGALEAAGGRPAAAAARLAPLMDRLQRHTSTRDLRWALLALSCWRDGASFNADARTPWEPK